MERHGLILVLLDVSTIWITGSGERRLRPLFWGLLKGTERWFGAGNAQSPIETGNAVGDERMRVFTGVRRLERR